MWQVVKVAGCQLRTGRVEAVGTETKWAVTPTCSQAIPESGVFDEYGAAIIQEDGPSAVFSFCHNAAVFRVILEGGPMVAPSDNLSCAEHLPILLQRLEAQARELAELFCLQCNKFLPFPGIDELSIEEICKCIR
jgi:hypothetical protein